MRRNIPSLSRALRYYLCITSSSSCSSYSDRTFSSSSRTLHPQNSSTSISLLCQMAAATRVFLGFAIGLLVSTSVDSTTDASDVRSLGILYGSLSSPPQLSGWKSNGGDPCGELWAGISCVGSAVTAIRLSGMGIKGALGYYLSGLISLKTLDMSNNDLQGAIPYQLPQNLEYLNFATNNITGNLPYSLSTMGSLNYLNVSHNLLSQSIGDIFPYLQNLSEIDLSFNSFSGYLPKSIGSLSNLSSLYLQDNQLTGSVNLLANLGLTELNIANNHFIGWIPQEFNSIPNLRTEGNSFANAPAPLPPPYTPPPPGTTHSNHPQSEVPADAPQDSEGQLFHPDNDNKKKHLTAGPVIGIVISSIFPVLFAVLAAIFCLTKHKRGRPVNSKDHLGSLSISKKRGEWHPFSEYISRHAPTEQSCRVKEPLFFNGQSSSTQQPEAATKEMREHKPKSDLSMIHLKPLPAEKMILEKVYVKNGSAKRLKFPITATSYNISSLQTATNSFNKEFIIGEGSLGRVYRAEFSGGKVLAVKKIDSPAVSLQEEDIFFEAVSNMSRLTHPNISALVGYCVEHGQRLLLYEYIGNGTLHEILHFVDDSSKKLTWNQRIRVALGTAKALEYLHEVFLPPVVHKKLKSANILLDEDLNPHLSDCGLAALTTNIERKVSTQVIGSFGYSAPEFTMSGVYTVKSDVYSFGVVMLELLTGRKPLDSSRVRSEQSLVQWAAPQLHDIDALTGMVDPALNSIYPAKSLSCLADIIALCIQPEPEFRPAMSEVVQALVRLMQRASTIKRSYGDENGYSHNIQEHEETIDMCFSNT